MIKLNFKIALRNLWKYKTYTLINIAGLTVGMACCILIFIFIRYQLSFDSQFKYSDRIYRIVTNWKMAAGTNTSQGVPIPLVKAITQDFPQVEKAAAIQGSYGMISINNFSGKPGLRETSRLFYAQPAFFEIFNFTWLAGNPQQALSQPNTVVLSDAKAIQYFGDWHKAVGKSIRLNNKADLKVTGVFKALSENTSLPLHVVLSYATFPDKNDKNWNYVISHSECYILLKKEVGIHDLAASLAAFNHKHYNDTDKQGQQYHSFQPLKDIHHNGLYGNFAHKTMEKKEIYGLVIIGVFLLLTACINFINISTAQAINRSKEVGIRKVMGSGRKQLMIQFLAETLTLSLIALLIACVLTEITIPYLQHLFDEPISFSLFEHPVIFVFLAGLVLTVGLLAGFYPAMVMSGFSPALAIKNKVASNQAGGLGLRRILVVVQFTITVVLIISTLVVLKQMNYMRQKPLGFNPDAVAMIRLPNDSQNQPKQNQLRERILTIPGVSQVSLCDMAPASTMVNESKFSINGILIKDFEVRVLHADQAYFETFNLKMIAGKSLSKSDTVNSYVVNETFLKKMNIASPELALGKLIRIDNHEARITGVVKDFNDKSLHQEISPLALSSDKGLYTNLAIKMERKDLLESMKQVESLWNTIFPQEVYEADFVSDDLNRYYQTEKVMGVLFQNFSVVIIFISFIGLFGLVSFVASQRTREVAIRKVLGATDFELVKLLNGSFLLLVFLSNLVAWPIAYLFISRWLAGYAYRIELNIWPFAIAMFTSMGITLLTVSFRSFSAARTNPADALKDE
ncbi:Putative ABC transporter permease [Pedobacter cryoconitis]|uniref:Putative ABC transporter permease n=1 Tax=Pedobacter cryoconitis TaxID=188932 RepID=A0A127V7E9_9SPHI|nr:ABC transporter permease [Pedobacter cryoconitis]AMP97204.1 Putative ABC transporter permease [Pedobacter cryoconitis]